MSIIFSAIVPHPPILLPVLNKDYLEHLENTQKSLDKIKKTLEKLKPDIIVVISPHGKKQLDVFSINTSSEFDINFEKFGDFNTNFKMLGEINLGIKIKEKLIESNIPCACENEDFKKTIKNLQLKKINSPELDHGTSLPLYFLAQNLEKTKILSIHSSGLSPEDHLNFGNFLGKELINSNKKIAIISSGDLSHSLSKNSPAKYSSLGEKFDKKLIKYLTNKNTLEILAFDKKLIKKAEECGLKSFLILLGILENIAYTPQLLSYEFPFGVGYLVMEFNN